MANCIVFGGNGLIGSFIAEQLVKKNYSVRVFDRNSENLSHLKEKIDFFQGDFLDFNAVEKALEEMDFVFHCIHTIMPRESILKPVFDAETNILPGINLFQKSAEKKVKKIVYLSSIAVYGNPEKNPITEKTALLPVSPYGVSKIAIEEYLGFFARTAGIDYCIARPSATFGERQKFSEKSGVITNFLFNAINGNPVTIQGNGSAVRDFTHAEDIAAGCILAMEKKTKSKIFNLGTGRGISVSELLEKIKKTTGAEIVVNHAETKDLVQKHVYNPERAKKELGWEAKISLDAGIKRTFDFLSGKK
ncbi:MAG TPA: NAD-dependent epimerase/dehydratase family protein [archaeon]|nr:NAD-dependent epimerase/dehydratase family protein [archaeon]